MSFKNFNINGLNILNSNSSSNHFNFDEILFTKENEKKKTFIKNIGYNFNYNSLKNNSLYKKIDNTIKSLSYINEENSLKNINKKCDILENIMEENKRRLQVDKLIKLNGLDNWEEIIPEYKKNNGNVFNFENKNQNRKIFIKDLEKKWFLKKEMKKLLDEEKKLIKKENDDRLKKMKDQIDIEIHKHKKKIIKIRKDKELLEINKVKERKKREEEERKRLELEELQKLKFKKNKENRKEDLMRKLKGYFIHLKFCFTFFPFIHRKVNEKRNFFKNETMIKFNKNLNEFYFQFNDYFSKYLNTLINMKEKVIIIQNKIILNEYDAKEVRNDQLNKRLGEIKIFFDKFTNDIIEFFKEEDVKLKFHKLFYLSCDKNKFLPNFLLSQQVTSRLEFDTFGRLRRNNLNEKKILILYFVYGKGLLELVEKCFKIKKSITRNQTNRLIIRIFGSLIHYLLISIFNKLIRANGGNQLHLINENQIKYCEPILIDKEIKNIKKFKAKNINDIAPFILDILSKEDFNHIINNKIFDSIVKKIEETNDILLEDLKLYLTEVEEIELKRKHLRKNKKTKNLNEIIKKSKINTLKSLQIIEEEEENINEKYEKYDDADDVEYIK